MRLQRWTNILRGEAQENKAKGLGLRVQRRNPNFAKVLDDSPRDKDKETGENTGSRPRRRWMITLDERGECRSSCVIPAVGVEPVCEGAKEVFLHIDGQGEGMCASRARDLVLLLGLWLPPLPTVAWDGRQSDGFGAERLDVGYTLGDRIFDLYVQRTGSGPVLDSFVRGALGFKAVYVIGIPTLVSSGGLGEKQGDLFW